jgi:tRNA (guanine37-N1)-methyltransferase
MRFDYLSVFPEMFAPYLDASIMGRAQRAGVFEYVAHDLRTWTHDRHHTVDDAPFGGGQGMLMKCEPIFEAVRAIEAMHEATPHVVFFTPAGTRFTEREACRLATRERILFVCGRYEGMDERVMELADECLSLGDFVLTGGELCALAVTDAVVRLVPGALGHDMSAVEESFSDDLLEHAQYTRPADFEGRTVPEVLLSGDHAAIARWKRRNAVERTARLRPDLIEKANLSEDERVLAMRIINTMTEEEA